MDVVLSEIVLREHHYVTGECTVVPKVGIQRAIPASALQNSIFHCLTIEYVIAYSKLAGIKKEPIPDHRTEGFCAQGNGR